MTNVIGPIDVEDWIMMRQLRQSIHWMQEKSTNAYYPGIKKEKQVYHNIMGQYLGGMAA